MPKLTKLIVPLALVALSSVAAADPWKDESGKGRHGDRRGEYKEEYWDGNCKVERKYEKHGEYKEKRKCKAPKRYVEPDYRYRQPVVEERVYYPAQHDYERREPGVAVDIRIRQ